MKKLFFVLFCLALVSCASNNVTSDGAFVTTYNEVTGNTETIHKDLKVGSFYNVRDSITGEREHVMLVIQNDKLLFGMLYQNSKWAFFNTAVFIANGQRLEIPLENRQTKIVSGDVLRENYTTLVSNETAASLHELLAQGSCGVAFIGENYTTEKIELKPKIRDALLATLEYYSK